ncbi:hypothetical protein Hesp01_47070 [Herbidospora sp. NBRC 101105]|nr:hypothetical protein Hesp01_47070 [Herbidospora sp. NBRC 101105]
MARFDAASVIDLTMAVILPTGTNNLGMLDCRMSAIPIADKMRAHISQIDRAHHHAVRPGVRAELAEVLAEASSLAGWQPSTPERSTTLGVTTSTPSRRLRKPNGRLFSRMCRVSRRTR